MAACTTTPSVTLPTASATTPSATAATSASFRPGELSCADAYTTESRGVDPAFTGSGVGFEGLSVVGFDPIPARNAVPWDASGYFSKSPIYLDNGVTWAEITSITGDAGFAWVPASVWTGSSRGSAGTYEALTARFESCGGSFTGFLGGILTPTAHACLTLGIRSNLHPEVERMPIAIGKGACG